MKRTRSEFESEDSSPVSWKRSGNKNVDHLHLYETGQMHDCTLKVGNLSLGYQEFKCHKVILGSASSVLQTTLFGSFKEASLGPDEPILIRDVAPQVFDIVMKFIYGGKTDFGNTTRAIEVYKFAHLMDISHLLKAVDTHLKKVEEPADIFAVFDLWITMDKKADLDRFEICWKVINSFPKEAFGSACWLKVSQDSVIEVLQNDLNCVSEETLYSAVVRWSLQNCDPSMFAEVRAKFEPFLKLIRFGAFSAKQFSNIFKAELMLSTEEKLKILISILNQSPKEMPAGFCRNMTRRDANTIAVVCTPYEIQAAPPNQNADCLSLCFSVDKAALIMGVGIHSNCIINLGHDFSVKVALHDPSGKDQFLQLQGETVRKKSALINLNCHLEANRLYIINFDLKDGSKCEPSHMAKLKSSEARICHPGSDLNVTFYSQSLHVLVISLFFKLDNPK